MILAVNDGESTRPARDLIENPAALAYLVVLTILVGFLAFLAISDQQAKQRARERAQRMEEDMQSVMATTQSLREQGKLEEASVLEGELRNMRRETKDFVAREAAKMQTQEQTWPREFGTHPPQPCALKGAHTIHAQATL